MNLGGIFGAIAGGWLADRLHIKYVLAGMYLIAAGSLAMLGQEVSTSLRYVLIGLAGGTTIGTQIVGCAYVGQFYPNTIRATGLGWRSEEHTSELQSLMRLSYAVFCLKKKKHNRLSTNSTTYATN